MPWLGGLRTPLDMVEFDDPAVSARPAGVETGFDIPIFSGLGQFHLNILTFKKQRFCTFGQQRFCKADKLM